MALGGSPQTWAIGPPPNRMTGPEFGWQRGQLASSSSIDSSPPDKVDSGTYGGVVGVESFSPQGLAFFVIRTSVGRGLP